MTETFQQIGRTYVRWRGRKLSYFGGCDYFRLASHPRVLRAVETGVRKFGLGVSASRRTTGNHVLYLQLEKELARFFGAEAALLVSGGYVTGQVATQALAGEFTHALMDEYSHLALLDAVQVPGCPVIRFKHADAIDLGRRLRQLGRNARPIVLTDGMFAYNGSTAPLAAYLKLLPARGLLLVDDAHGAGTLGRTGKGTVEVEGVSRRQVIQCVTLSKAFGVYGGALLCSQKMREHIVAHSHLFTGSTPLPLPLAYAALEALRVLKTDKGLRRRLRANVQYVRQALRKAGIDVPDTPGPVVSIFPKSPREAAQLKQQLLAAGILPPYLNYPGGPVKGYFRFVISSEHSRGQLGGMVRALKKSLQK